MTSREHVQAQQTRDEQENRFIETAGTSLNDEAFQTIVSTENLSVVNESGLSTDQVADTSTNDDALQMVVVHTENLTNNEPESQNQLALPCSNSNINPLLDWSSGSEWSVTTESSVEPDERPDQLLHHTPNGANQLQLPQSNAPTFINKITGNENVHPVYNVNHNFYCCSFERCFGGDSASNKRCIAGVTVTLLGITIPIFLCIWFLIPSSSKQQYVLSAINSTTPSSDPPIPGMRIVSRTEWLARLPLKEKLLVASPVKTIIIMHTGRLTCFEQSECANAVKSLQEIDMDYLGKTDISYNWLIGGDGLVYMGRGWNVEGDHTKGYDNRTIGIAFIGNFEKKSPTSAQIRNGEKLIRKGVDEKWIDKDYNLIGQRQCINSHNPGEKLYNIIKDWHKWSPACF